MISEPYDIGREDMLQDVCLECLGSGLIDVYINEYDLDEQTCPKCDGQGVESY